MTLEEFRDSLGGVRPPDGLSVSLLALWHDGRGHWVVAHDALQDHEDVEAAWVHAYLHRKEGDLANAGYWYRRARRPVATGPLDDEWSAIAAVLLAAMP